jgi:hypothetical protein
LVIRTAFNRWSSVSPFKFRDVTGINDITPNINVGFFSGCHDDPDCFDGPLQVLAHGYYPEDGHLHFDLDEHWAYPSSASIKKDISMYKFFMNLVKYGDRAPIGAQSVEVHGISAWLCINYKYHH